MQQSKSFLASVLFVLLGAAAAVAAPVAEPAVPAAEAAQVSVAVPAEAAPAADCAVSPFASDVVTSASLDYVCGSCSQSPCAGQAVNNVCGFANGKFKYCQDWLGSTCPADGNARCRCSSDPIP